MAKKKVAIIFDFENDKHYRYLVKAWDANSDFEFVFSVVTSDEIKSENIDRIKGALTAKINKATYSLIIVGKEANIFHDDYLEIGYRNWINFEIARSKANKNKLVAVKLDREYESPEELIRAGAHWALSFNQQSIINALDKAAAS